MIVELIYSGENKTLTIVKETGTEIITGQLALIKLKELINN